MTDKKCPCKNCICLPICRHKSYASIFNDCILIKEYEPNWKVLDARKEYRIYEIQRILNTTKWRYRRVKGSEYPRIIRVLQELI